MTILGLEFSYEGEIDKSGKAFGSGKAISVKYPDCSHEGTFIDDKRHGICRQYIFLFLINRSWKMWWGICRYNRIQKRVKIWKRDSVFFDVSFYTTYEVHREKKVFNCAYSNDVQLLNVEITE